jgi:hypothetical protein
MFIALWYCPKVSKANGVNLSAEMYVIVKEHWVLVVQDILVTVRHDTWVPWRDLTRMGIIPPDLGA